MTEVKTLVYPKFKISIVALYPTHLLSLCT